MNEKERMLAGLMYDATDKELEKERFAAEELYFKFNNSSRPNWISRITR